MNTNDDIRKIYWNKINELKIKNNYRPLLLDAMEEIYVFGNAYSIGRFISLDIFSVEDVVNLPLQLGFPNLICSVASSINTWNISEDEVKKIIDKFSTAIIETNDPLWIWKFLSSITIESTLSIEKNVLEKLVDSIIKTKDLMKMKFCLRIIAHYDEELKKKLSNEILTITNNVKNVDKGVDYTKKLKKQ